MLPTETTIDFTPQFFHNFGRPDLKPCHGLADVCWNGWRKFPQKCSPAGTRNNHFLCKKIEITTNKWMFEVVINWMVQLMVERVVLAW